MLLRRFVYPGSLPLHPPRKEHPSARGGGERCRRSAGKRSLNPPFRLRRPLTRINVELDDAKRIVKVISLSHRTFLLPGGGVAPAAFSRFLDHNPSSSNPIFFSPSSDSQKKSPDPIPPSRQPFLKARSLLLVARSVQQLSLSSETSYPSSSPPMFPPFGITAKTHTTKLIFQPEYKNIYYIYF